MKRVLLVIRHVALVIVGVLCVFGGARSASAAAPCPDASQSAPPVLVSTQGVSNTLQPSSNLFVCRVDGAGALANGSAVSTRSVTTAGLVLLVVARWLHFAGYALGFGTIVFGLWLATRGLSGIWTRRVWWLAHAGIVLLLSAEPLALLAQTIGVQNTFFDVTVAGEVLASGFGLVWAQRVGVALLLWVVIGIVNDGVARALWAVPVLGIVLAVVDANAGAGDVRLPVLAIAAAAFHQAAMGVWIGGLGLLLAVWSNPEPDWHTRLLKHFGRLSALAIGILGITGVTMAALRVTQPNELFATLYGAVLSIKLLLALFAIGLAVYVPRVHHTLWRWRAALTTLVVVLGVASLLVSVPAP